MRIPVILVARANDYLREAALAAGVNMAAGVDAQRAGTFRGVELDPTFAPVPLGSSQPGGTVLE